MSNTICFSIHNPTENAEEADRSDWPPHKLAVIVPFRDRFEEMMEFVPWIHKFLNDQQVHHQIIVVNQIDSHRYVFQPVFMTLLQIVMLLRFLVILRLFIV